jgi:hypothetical protein
MIPLPRADRAEALQRTAGNGWGGAVIAYRHKLQDFVVAQKFNRSFEKLVPAARPDSPTGKESKF